MEKNVTCKYSYVCKVISVIIMTAILVRNQHRAYIFVKRTFNRSIILHIRYNTVQNFFKKRKEKKER